jgi:hypothetical protein
LNLIRLLVSQAAKGLSPVLTSLGISSFVYFYAFNGLKAIVMKRAKDGRLTTAMNLLIASVAGVMFVTLRPSIMIGTHSAQQPPDDNAALGRQYANAPRQL